MFTNPIKARCICINKDIFRSELKRHISKTCALNSECLSSKEETKNSEGLISEKWMKLRKHSSSRFLSTANATAAIPQPALTLVSKEENNEFMSIFQDVICDLTFNTDLPSSELNKQFVRALEYNVAKGKKYSGLLVVAAYKMLESPQNFTAENILLGNILGWCVEMLHSSLLMRCDIMAGSETRNGLLCWYKNADVGLQAIHDSLMIKSRLYLILKKYFSSHQCYVPILNLFNEVFMKTSMGQSLSAMSTIDGRPKLDSFSMNRYSAIVKYKTAYHSFQLPIALAMYLAGINDPEMHRQAKTISLELAHFFQVQDDFLDCFGDPETAEKEGTDIRKGKCSWLAVMALQRATPAQKQILEDHYGKPNPESEATVRNLFEELDLPNTYFIYKKETLNLIHTHIQQMTKGVLDKLFFKLIDKV